MNNKKHSKTLSGSIFQGLLLIVAIAVIISLAILWIIETKTTTRQTKELMMLNMRDVRADIIDTSDENLLKLTREAAAYINGGAATDEAALKKMAKDLDVTEINIVDKDGFIIATTDPAFLHFDMKSGEQSEEFAGLLDGTATEVVQRYQPTASDPSKSRKYAAVCLDAGGFVQTGYDGAHLQDDINQDVIGITRNRHIGENGQIIITDENWNIVSIRADLEGNKLEQTGLVIDPSSMPAGEMFRAKMFGEPYLCMYEYAEGYYMIAALPKKEAISQRKEALWLMILLLAIIFIALFIVLFWLIRKRILRNIDRVNESLNKITEGDLNEVVDVHENREFSMLSDDINATVSTLKQYISDAEKRIDEELAFARNIQTSALPSVFPPFPGRSDFSLFATMCTAREVGGDFYDFYLLKNNELAFLIADVSGKGIPAALFMMSGKTVLHDYAGRRDDLPEIFRNANRNLCEGNEAEMFITAWMGFLDTDTGLVRFVNAGHLPPVLIRGGEASFIPMKANLVLAFLEDAPYEEQSIHLQPGDLLFLYTDGVTEAINTEEEMYGNERLLKVLSGDFGSGEEACRSACSAVTDDVAAFVGEAAQFDDITMLCLYYTGKIQ